MYRRARLGIGYLPQETSIFRGLCVEDNISAILDLSEEDRHKRRERLEELLADFGLEHLRRTSALALSGGERRRVEIARSLAAHPKYLLLDEPFGALDLQIRETMQDFLLKLWPRTGLTVLLITHDVEEALVLAQRVHVLAPNPGRIIRSLDVILDKSDLDQLRLSSDFLQLRRSLATSLRQLEPTIG